MNPSQILKPYITEEKAKELALKLYGLEVVSVEEMVSFDDRNFHIKVSPKHSNPYLERICQLGYTLKITNAGKSAIEGHFESMHNVLMHMKKEGVTMPYPVRNLKGNTWTLEELPVLGGEVKDSSENVKKDICGVHMLTYIPGVPVGSVRYTRDILYQWGKLLAKFHNCLQDYKCPIFEKKCIYWNLYHVPEIKDFMEGLSEPETSLVKDVLKNFPERILSSDTIVTKGLLHGDFNENNILVQVQDNNGHKKYAVDGILDLEDMHYGVYIWDVGVMMAYVMLYCEDFDPIEGIAHATAGYLALRSLNNEELSLLKICTACRLSQSAVLGTYSHKLHPENPYLISALENKWSSLRSLWRTPNDLLMRKIEDVLEKHKKLNSSTENQIV